MKKEFQKKTDETERRRRDIESELENLRKKSRNQLSKDKSLKGKEGMLESQCFLSVFMAAIDDLLVLGATLFTQ